MLKEERFQIILKQLGLDQKVYLAGLSTLLNVSEDTIRRDIKELADQGLLKSVRGGAVPHSPGPHHFRDRILYDNEQKQIIAKKALGFLKDDQVVLFDGGTSAMLIAQMLPKDLRLTVITNSFPIASLLEEHEHVEVLVCRRADFLKIPLSQSGAIRFSFSRNSGRIFACWEFAAFIPSWVSQGHITKKAK
jgi:DeoR/GlpR family transcriptional regulator of sugar metabolism